MSVLSGAFGDIRITVFASLNGEYSLLPIFCCSCGLPLRSEILIVHSLRQSPATSPVSGVQTVQLQSELFQ